ncbi:protein of unknown function DUF1659 [Gottschalkia purinilytica]|uniref:DUF1659 domain-containing protein n=1 Tax=Gottschalkia purinilytica TaxID=1503 RepID=A0A0L0WE28_GOTPU|nr:DUF1659 domain-containing protein [Gottschalkia purinilytica]KNF09675.1 protein of unknown function DUF1659 [Gottschalkia purinilytica]
MPATSEIKKSKLKLVFKTGENERGEDILNSKIFQNIKPASSNDDVYEVAKTLIGLQNLESRNVIRVNELEIQEQ